jgi:transcriptional regulator with XRE-family HTH domain
MTDGGSPLVQRRRLRAELRKARQATDPLLTQEQVAREMDWSLSKVIRIEAGSSGISANDLKALLRLYGVTEADHVNELVGLARAARERSWWSEYRNVAPQSLLQLIEYESAAHAIRQFETTLVPGILQTKDYARAVIRNYYEEGPDSNLLGPLVELRTRRENLFNSDNPPLFHFMLDEAVIRRLVGGASVMHRQLRRLLEVAERPNITVEVVPFSAGVHPGMKGPFKVIEFADPLDRDIVFLESPRGDIISDDPEGSLSYREAFDKLGKVSLGPRDSLAFIARIADGMDN